MKHLTLDPDVLASVPITDIRHTLSEIDKHRHVYHPEAPQYETICAEIIALVSFIRGWKKRFEKVNEIFKTDNKL